MATAAIPGGSDASPLYDPAAREAKYSGNTAQYLVDLHDARGTFDFCGGMMFQLVLSDTLRARLLAVAQGGGAAAASQPNVFDATMQRMMQTPGYQQNADADNVQYFHGREVRKVKSAAGGMGFVLHLSDTDDADPEAWTPGERADYDGWGHDSRYGALNKVWVTER